MKAVCLLAVCLAAAPAFGAGKGLKPRKSADEYASRAEKDGVAVAATLLSPEDVKKLFSTDLNRGYMVVEVAVYPKEGQTLDLSSDDFTLRVAGTSTSARAAHPATIAGILGKGPEQSSGGGRNVDIYPTVGIGYETGGYDPMTGRRGGGVYTSTGVGVGIGGSNPPAPGRTPQDRRTMEMELTDQALPEGPAAKPVAGYLYFPTPTKKKVAFDLEYAGKGLEIDLPLKVAAPVK